MNKFLSIPIIFSVLLFAFSCEKVQEYNNALGSWKVGEACTFKYGTKTGVLTQKYLNQIIGHYAGIEADSTMVLVFDKAGTISTNGKTLEASSWSQNESSVTIKIGEGLTFNGTVYFNYIVADAADIKVDVLPDKIYNILLLVISDLSKGVVIDNIKMYLDRQ